MNAAIGAHGQRGTQTFSRLVVAQHQGHHLLHVTALLLELDGLLHAVLVERIQHQFEPGGFNPGASGGDLDRGVGVRHLLDDR